MAVLLTAGLFVALFVVLVTAGMTVVGHLEKEEEHLARSHNDHMKLVVQCFCWR